MINDYFRELAEIRPQSKNAAELETFIRDQVAAELRSVSGVELPDLGRSSFEESARLEDMIVEFESFFSFINPAVPFDFLDFLGIMAAINPDVSQAVKNYENFANTGHSVTIDAPSAGLMEAAITRINEQASSLYKKSCGVDGLINHYIRQIATYGALSSEDVIADDFSGIEEVVIVPVSRIRFKLKDGKYKPFQLVNPMLQPQGLVELNENTYSYFAWRTIENSPYAYPPFTSAIEAILMQHDMTANIKFVLRKMGLLGLIAMTLKKPPKLAGEDDVNYRARAKKETEAIAGSILANYHKGMLIKYEEQTIEHFNVTADARGGSDLFSQNEQQVFSGLGTQPALHGRTYSTTETYAGVVYNMLVTDALNIQRLPKRRMEQTYRLDLLLQGIQVDGVTMNFNKTQALNKLQDAEAESSHIDNVFKKRDGGIISQDQSAQELGYDAAFQPQTSSNVIPFKGSRNDSIIQRFSFDREGQRYRIAQ